MREDRPSELVDCQLGRLDMHVSVDEARDDIGPRDVDALVTLITAEPNDVTVLDGYVNVEPFLREDGENAPAGQHKVGGLIAPCDRHPVCVDDGLA
jgi:hypothetical protein